MKYIILGSGIAGMAAAEAIRNEELTAEILMVSAEKELCFNRPMLIKEFALDGSGAALFERQQNWPDLNRVEVQLGVEVRAIDRKNKTVETTKGSFHYDKLIYALGAEATVPPIHGADKDHVFVVRTRDDMRKIRAAMRQAKNAVVIGGGMLGLEDAWAMVQEKLHVTIIEQKQRVAFGQIDQSAGNLMKKRIERMGVDVYVNATVVDIGDNTVTFHNGEGEMITIPADMIIMSAGVTPNIALGEAAGLKTTGQWIDADDSCRTSDPDIYAAGDAVAVNGRSDAIWDEARQMGRVAGINASGGNARYVPVTAEHVFTGFDTEVFTFADSSGAGTDGVYIRHADVEIFDYQRERYIRVSLQDGVIAGALLINASELAPELMEAYRNGEGEEEARQIIQRWKKSHDVDFKPAAPFRKR